VQASPSIDSCRDLLLGLPSFTALRRELARVTPDEARTWLDALYALRVHPDGLRVTELAELLRVDPSVASRKFAHLEDAQLAVRSRDPRDGRASVFQLTDDGTEWLDSNTDTYARHLTTLLHGWSSADVSRFAALLQRLGTTLDEGTR
jgi:DNA-binding MarR family transcriptional regulator